MLGCRHFLQASHRHTQTVKDVYKMRFGVEEVDGLALCTPALAVDSAGHKESQVLSLGVALRDGQFLAVLCFLLCVLDITASKLIDFLIENLVVHIVNDALQSAVEQCLAHNVEFLGERIEDSYATLGREVGIAVIVAALGQRVVHYLVEAVVGEIVGCYVLKLLRIRFGTIGQTAVQTLIDFDVVVAIYSHNLLYHIAFAVHIDLAGGYSEQHTVLVFFCYLNVE